MKAKSTFLPWNVLPLPTWAPGRPNDDGPGLPMTAHGGGNISPERRITSGGCHNQIIAEMPKRCLSSHKSRRNLRSSGKCRLIRVGRRTGGA